MECVELARWGFTGRFPALAAQEPALEPARVVSQEKGIYRVVCAAGERSAAVSGRFRHEAQAVSDYPAVGDFVLLGPEEGGTAVIRRVLPRKSLFLRRAAGTAKTEQVVAANIDTVFLCMALNNDFNLRRLERYLAVAWDSGARPVVVLTKSDLCGDLVEKLAAVRGVAMGADVAVTTALGQDGYAPILPFAAPGQTVAFVGSSGAGKSTLINRLLGGEVLPTNGLRNDDRGRHTTTHRELLPLANGAMVIDTPGMRELGLWDAAEGLGAAFADVESLAAACRFRNCTHGEEPGCAVRAALERGELAPERLASWRKLAAESAFAEDAGGYLAAKEKKFKAIAKYNKTNGKR